MNHRYRYRYTYRYTYRYRYRYRYTCVCGFGQQIQEGKWWFTRLGVSGGGLPLIGHQFWMVWWMPCHALCSSQGSTHWTSDQLAPITVPHYYGNCYRENVGEPWKFDGVPIFSRPRNPQKPLHPQFRWLNPCAFSCWSPLCPVFSKTVRGRGADGNVVRTNSVYIYIGIHIYIYR